MTNVIPFARPADAGVPESLISLATTIRDQYLASCMAAISAVEHARACGDALAKAKAQVEHGHWLIWLAANCADIPERTAQTYMKVADKFREDPVFAAIATSLPLRDVVGLLAEKRERAKTQRVADLSPKAQIVLDELPEERRPNKTTLRRLESREKCFRKIRKDLKAINRQWLYLQDARLQDGVLHEAELARDALDRFIKELKATTGRQPQTSPTDRGP